MPFNDYLDRKNVLELLSKVRPRHAREYAGANGWNRKPKDFGGLAVFDHTQLELTQLLIPIDADANDYPTRMLDVVQRIAEVENRPIIEVSNDLLNPDSDVVRYRVVDPTISLDLGLLKGIEILDGARRSLLSAAHSILAPLPYHPRLSRREAKEFVDQCRLKQTEHGSFVIAVACPLDAVDSEGLLEGFEPFTRQATQLLMDSLLRIESCVEADDEARLTATPNGEIPVSGNLCDAIARMEPPSNRGTVEVSTTWASTHPNPNCSKRQSVSFGEDHFEVIRDVSMKLRPSHQAEVANFVGQVETLNGNLNTEDRRYGEVSLDLLYGDELIRTRVDLNPDQYAIADAAHMSGSPVIMRGELHRGRRAHRITNITRFQSAESLAEPSE